MAAATFDALLARRRRSDPGRPLVTFLDETTGERVELSALTYANWVAKTAGLVRDDLEVERGGLVLLDLPTHWTGPVWLGAAWTLGLVVTDRAELAEQADLVVCGPEGVERYAPLSSRRPVVALSLRPLGGRFAVPLPDGVTDYHAVVLAQPDDFTPYDAASGSDPAWRDAEGSLSQAQLLDAGGPLPRVGLGAGDRLITDVNAVSRAGLATLLEPLQTGTATIWVADPDPARWAHRVEEERTTHELRQPPRL